MKRTWTITGVVAVLAIVVVLAGFALLFDADPFRPRVEAALTQALHRPTHIGKLSLSILHGRVEVDGLSIAEDPAFGATPFIQAKSAGLQVGLWNLIAHRQLEVNGIVISQPAISLIQDVRGVWNYASLGSQAGSSNGLSIAELHISSARITLNQSVLENTDITASNISRTTAFPFAATGKVASGGDFKIDGKAGPIPAADASKIPLQVTLKVQNLKLDPYGAGGLLSLDGQASSDGRTLDLNVSARIDGARFAAKGAPARAPLAMEIGLKQNLETHQGSVTRGTLHIGKADATFSGTYAANGRNDTLNLRLLAKSMPLPELLAFVPALDIQLPAGSVLQGGTLSADLTAVGDATQPVVAGTIDINNTRLGGFNVGEKLGPIERLAGIQPAADTEIQRLHTRIRAAASGTTVEDLDLVLPAVGEVTGAGTVSPSHQLNFKMRATVKAAGAALGAVPFFVQGTSPNPVFRPDTGAIVTEELERLGGKNIGGVDAGAAVDAIKGIFGRGKKQ